MADPPSIPRDYTDRILRSLWRREPTAMLRLALGRPTARVVRTLDSAAVSVGRTVDGAALVEDDAGPFVAHVEYETDARAEALRRMALCGFWLHLHYDLPVRSVLVAVDPAPELPTALTMIHNNEELCRYRVDVRRLYEIPVAWASLQPDLAVLTPLLAGATIDDIRVARRTLHQAPRGQRGDRLAELYILGGRRFDVDLIRRLFTKEELMESVTWRAILEEGIEQGVKMGFGQGLSQGLSQGMERLVRRLIARRFPEAAADLDPLIESCSDSDLEAISDAILEAQTADDLRSFVQERLQARSH